MILLSQWGPIVAVRDSVATQTDAGSPSVRLSVPEAA